LLALLRHADFRQFVFMGKSEVIGASSNRRDRPAEISARDANGSVRGTGASEAEPALSDLAHKQVKSKKAMSAPRKDLCRAQPKEIAMTDLPSVKDQALTSDELDHVCGGIIIVGGLQRQFISALERAALNPQPLPPRNFSFDY
jgi:hypothetical protein